MGFGGFWVGFSWTLVGFHGFFAGFVVPVGFRGFSWGLVGFLLVGCDGGWWGLVRFCVFRGY